MPKITHSDLCDTPQRSRKNQTQALNRIEKSIQSILNKIKDLDDPMEIMNYAAGSAAKTVFASLISGSNSTRNQAAKEILDRVLGKPIERQMNMNFDVHKMKSKELDNELIRLMRKIGPEVVKGIIEGGIAARSFSEGDGGGDSVVAAEHSESNGRGEENLHKETAPEGN